jgi:hypothetical protein
MGGTNLSKTKELGFKESIIYHTRVQIPPLALYID